MSSQPVNRQRDEQVVIRPERDDDRDAIRAVVAAAFKGETEAELVEHIRASEHYIPELSLVAELDGAVVGHVMISYVFLNDEGDHEDAGNDGNGHRGGVGRGGVPARRILSLSPLAVAPDLHGQGIGGALVRSVTAAAVDRGEPLVVLEGSPVYYARFGFEPAAAHGLHISLPDWAPPEAAQVLLLPDHDPSLRGRVVYPPAFDAVTDH